MRKTWLVAFVVVAGCGREPVLDARGTYAVSGRWTVGAPMADGRTPGDVAAELLIEEAVALSPIPETFEDEAREKLGDAIGARIADAVDANLPPELRAGSELRADLAEVLGSVDVESRLVLDRGGPLDGPLAGEETLVSVSMTRDGVRHDYLPAWAAERGAIEAAWDAEGNGESGLSVEEHDFAIEYTALVRFAVETVLAGPSLTTLEEQAADSVPCAELVSPVTIDAGGASFTIAANTLEAACAVARNETIARLLGHFDHALLTAGGGVRAIDEDGDGHADRLESRGGYGGTVAVPLLPDAISPVVLAEFDATRI